MMDHSVNFLQFLQQFRRGELIRQGDALLSDVVEAMKATGGNGEINIKLPFKLNKAGQIECTPKVEAKVPRHQVGTGIYFADDEGRLSTRDPNQYDIEDEIARQQSDATH